MNALVAGAGAAANGVGKGAYVHLKNLLITKFKDHQEASRALSAGDIDEEKWRTTITSIAPRARSCASNTPARSTPQGPLRSRP